MAFMCADSGNLTAIAKQVIQQQQQHQQRQQLNHQNQQLLLVQDRQLLFGEQQQLLPDESDYYAAATLPPPWTAAVHQAEDPQHAASLFYPDSLPAFSSAFPNFAPPPLPPRAEFEAYQWVDSLAEASDVAGEAWCAAGAAGSDLAEIFSSCLSSPDELYRVLISEPPESPKVATAAVHVDRNMSPSPPPSLRQEAWSVLPAGSPNLQPSPNQADEVVVSAPPSWHPLLRSLVDCARIVDYEPDLSAKSLIRFMDSAFELGDPAERVAFYVSRALYRRLTAAKPRSSSPSQLPRELSLLDDRGAWPDDYALHYRAFYDACPYAKFADITANQAILEAIDSAAHIHVVDFGITHGVQWAALLQDLATRPSGKPASVRISAVPAAGFPHSALAQTGARLRDFAAGLGLGLELRVDPVLVQPLQLTASSFRVEPGETLAVNFMLQLGGFLGGAASLAGVERLLRLAKSLRPKVVTLGEHEVSIAGGVTRRVGPTVGFYAAVFESLEPAMARDSPERAGIERTILGPRVAAVVEGKLGMADKREWLGLMERCGFQAVQPSNYAVSQAKLLLWNYNYSARYSLVESQPAFLSIAWDERPILTVSSWR